MTKNLEAFITGAVEPEKRKAQCLEQRAKVRADIELEFERATGPDDGRAFNAIGKLRDQEQLLNIQIEKCEREAAGAGAALLNEAEHVRRAVIKLLADHRGVLRAQWDKALVPIFPDERQRKKMLDSHGPQPPALHAVGKLLSGLCYLQFRPPATEMQHARAVLSLAKQAAELCKL